LRSIESARLQHARAPIEHRIGERADQAEIGRHLPGERIADQSKKVRRGQAYVACMHEHPRRHRQGADQGRQTPDHQHELPASAQHLLKRHRRRHRQGRPDADHHGVEAHHQADVSRKVALDERRRQYAEETQARADHDGAEIERSDALAAHQAADRDPEQRHEQHPLQPEAPRQPRRGRREQAEADDRQHGQNADGERGNPEVALDGGEKQRHRRDGRTQIKSDQQHGCDRPGGMEQPWRHRPPTGRATGVRLAPRFGLIGKDIHRDCVDVAAGRRNRHLRMAHMSRCRPRMRDASASTASRSACRSSNGATRTAKLHRMTSSRRRRGALTFVISKMIFSKLICAAVATTTRGTRIGCRAFCFRLLAYDLWGRDRQTAADYGCEKRFNRRARGARTATT
jgi:hypothetical protein